MVWCGCILLGKHKDEDGKREVVVAWRGTQVLGSSGALSEWKKDAQFALEPWKAPPINYMTVAGEQVEYAEEKRLLRGLWEQLRQGRKGTKVHRGFQLLYNRPCKQDPLSHDVQVQPISPRQVVLRAMKEIQKKHTVSKVIVTGHSLGGALAYLCGYDLAKKLNVDEYGNSVPPVAPMGDVPVFVYTFAAPKIGNRALVNDMGAQETFSHLRMFNKHDLVPKVPNGVLQYVTTGGMKHENKHPLKFDSNVLAKAKVIKKPSRLPWKVGGNLGDYHNLEMYLHILDPSRPPELMNKSSNIVPGIAGSWLSGNAAEGEGPFPVGDDGARIQDDRD
ncbi:unnamed protein product [Chrysoparadoxa australica]